MSFSQLSLEACGGNLPLYIYFQRCVNCYSTPAPLVGMAGIWIRPKKIVAFLQIIFVVVLEAINSLKEYLNASQITRTIYA